MKCLISKELVFTHSRAAHHQPSSASSACHSYFGGEIKGGKPSRTGLVWEEDWAGGGVGREVFVLWLEVSFEGCCVVLLLRGWGKQDDSAEGFGDVDLLLKSCLRLRW